MPRDLKVYLEDMVEACRRIIEYTQNNAEKALAEDIKTLDAVVRNLEMLGEVAKKIPDEFRTKHPEIEWKKSRGFAIF